MKVVRVPSPMDPDVTIQPPNESTTATAPRATHSMKAEMLLSKKMVPFTARR